LLSRSRSQCESLDGRSTFRGMGMMSLLQQLEQFLSHLLVKRLQSCMTAAEVVHNRGIPIVPCIAGDISKSGLTALSLLKH